MPRPIPFEHEASRAGTRPSRSNAPISAEQLSCFIVERMEKKRKEKKARESATRIKALFHVPLADKRDLCINERKPGNVSRFRH